ncbi:MAG: YncE family protein [Ginsengibacter sp.]
MMISHLKNTIVVILLSSLQCVAQGNKHKIVKTYTVGGSGGWDYIAVNDNKLYVSHGTQVNILNENSGDSVGVIPGTTGVHGIAFCNDLRKGYTSNGRLNNVFVFDLSTNKILKQISTGENPDAISYESFSKKIITCNGRGKSLTVIDPVNDTVIATIELNGKPEEAVSNGKGKLYVNLEDKNEIAEIDMKTYKVLNRWPIAPGESATGLAIDTKTNRLFAGCDNKLLVVVDAKNGKVVTSLPIGDGCDGVVFDEKEKTVYTSNGEGNVTSIKEKDEDKFEVTETIPTKKSARTLTIDQATHALFLPSADIEPAAPGDAPNARRKIVPGSFKVLVVQ